MHVAEPSTRSFDWLLPLALGLAWLTESAIVLTIDHVSGFIRKMIDGTWLVSFNPGPFVPLLSFSFRSSSVRFPFLLF